MKTTTRTMMRKRKEAERWAVRGVPLGGRWMTSEGGARQRGVVQAFHLLINNARQVMILTVFDLLRSFVI